MNYCKKASLVFIVLVLCAYAVRAQELIITEVDAVENVFFNEASMLILGKKMVLNLAGNTLSVKIENEPELILTKVSGGLYESERKTKDATEKFSMKVKTTGSEITFAEFTGSIIPKGVEEKKVWWTVSARKSDTVTIR